MNANDISRHLATRISGILTMRDAPATVFYSQALEADLRPDTPLTITIKTDTPVNVEHVASFRALPVADVEGAAVEAASAFVTARNTAIRRARA